jgi:predicted alpha/beta-hydrolase family hydrolase
LLRAATVRAAVLVAGKLAPALPLVAGGKSFGGRMTSQAQAASPLPGVRGLVFFGFPLHAPNRPADERGAHLLQVRIPMLFLQGTRDALADLTLMRALVKRLRKFATLKVLPGADHSFHVLVRSGRTDEQVRGEMLDALIDWIASVL